MMIEIPDNVVHVVLTDLQASGLGGCKIVASLIQKNLDDKQLVEALLVDANMTLEELYEALENVSPGFQRFRLLKKLQMMQQESLKQSDYTYHEEIDGPRMKMDF